SADAPCRVDEVVCWPVLIGEGAPDCIVVVYRNRVSDAQVVHRTANVVDILLEREFRRVHTNYDQSVVPIFVRPCAQVRKGPQAIDAGVGPEIDQHYFAAQALTRQWGAIEPGNGSRERRKRALVWQSPLSAERGGGLRLLGRLRCS